MPRTAVAVFRNATERSRNATEGVPYSALVLLCLLAVGCGLNRSRLATEQLVVSDAVDRAVAEIDFSPLSGRKIFFDTKYLESVKLTPVGNVEYVISSLRQQMAAYDCRLQEKVEDAEFVVEARVGVLAHDGHELTYGVPGSAAMTTASVFLAAPIPAPAMPELSLGRRNHQQGTAKIGVFAYDRKTREPVWQAGLHKGASRSRDMWLFGLGPFESAGPVEAKKKKSTFFSGKKSRGEYGASDPDPHEAYAGSVVFERALARPEDETSATKEEGVQTASFEEPKKLPAGGQPETAKKLPPPSSAPMQAGGGG
jgi:hypothetical protein